MTRRRVIGALLALLAAAGSARAAEPLALDVILSLSGFGSLAGQAEQKGFEAVAGVINRQGGIAGRPVRFVFHDDQTTPQVAVQLATDIIARRPAMFLGPNLAATCNAIAPLLKAGPVMYCLSPAIQTVPGSFVFSASIPTDDLLETVIRYSHSRGWDRLGLLVTTDASGQDAERAFQRALALPEFSTMRIVAQDRFNPADVTVAAQLEKLRQAEPQALLAWTTGAAVATIFRGLQQAGYDLPVATSTGNALVSLMRQFGPIAPKTLYFALGQGAARGVDGATAGELARKAAFVEAYQGAGLAPDNAAETVWDAALLTAAALDEAGPDPTAAQVRAALAHMSGFQGVSGVYDFPAFPQRGLKPRSAVVVRWDPAQNGFEAVSKPGGEAAPGR